MVVVAVHLRVGSPLDWGLHSVGKTSDQWFVTKRHPIQTWTSFPGFLRTISWLDIGLAAKSVSERVILVSSEQHFSLIVINLRDYNKLINSLRDKSEITVDLNGLKVCFNDESTERLSVLT